MLKGYSPRWVAVLQAILVTLLWSSSIILIKFGLQDIPALTFAGLRYGLAFLCLVPFALRSSTLQTLSLHPAMWVRLVALGFLLYGVTQGAQFLGLFYLSANTNNLLLSFSTVAVALLGILLLGERPTPLQWLGVSLYLVGAIVYFYPASLPMNEVIGLTVTLIGVLANALSSVLGRHVNRNKELEPITVTVISMGVGAAALLIAGLSMQGLPQLDLTSWGIILWLAVVNSAFAYTLWNRTLRTLSATESSVINSLMLVQVPALAYIFLGEHLSWREMIGLAVAGIGILTVQLHWSKDGA